MINFQSDTGNRDNLQHNHSHIVILVGRSGSGKGTQGFFIKEYFEKKFPQLTTHYISTGERFRNFINSGSYSAELSKKINTEGGLQPEFLAIWNWSNILVDTVKEKSNVIFDGAPRKLHEGEVLDSAIKFYNWQKPLVLEIDVSPETALERLLSRRREDDSKEVIKERLSWYERDVVPLINCYQGNPLYTYKKINGERTVDEIKNEITTYLESHLN